MYLSVTPPHRLVMQPLKGASPRRAAGWFCTVVQLLGQLRAAGATSLLQAVMGTMVQLLTSDYAHSQTGSRCFTGRGAAAAVLPQCCRSAAAVLPLRDQLQP